MCMTTCHDHSTIAPLTLIDKFGTNIIQREHFRRLLLPLLTSRRRGPDRSARYVLGAEAAAIVTSLRQSGMGEETHP